jgi:hypothetical protein
MRISTSATIEVSRPREQVFDCACACATYEKLFKARGPIAGIVKAHMIDGASPATGTRRRIELSDGGVIEESVLAWDRPARHTYRWTRGLRGVGKLLVRSGEGDWIFRETAGGTRIEWGYTFELTTPVVYPAALIMVGQFRRWMEQQLRAIDASLTG